MCTIIMCVAIGLTVLKSFEVSESHYDYSKRYTYLLWIPADVILHQYATGILNWLPSSSITFVEAVGEPSLSFLSFSV